MPRFGTSSDDDVENDIDKISTEFACVKIAVMKKGLKVLELHKTYNENNESNVFKNSFKNDVQDENQDSSNNSQNNSTQSPNNNVSPQKEPRFSIEKILVEKEKLRRDDVRKAIQLRKEQMDEFERSLTEESVRKMSMMALKRQQKQAALLARIQAEEEQFARQSEMRRKHEQQLQAQRIQERDERFKRECAEHQRKVQERDEIIERIMPARAAFHSHCEAMNMLDVTCKDRHAASAALAPHISKMQELACQLENISERARTGEVVIEDIDAIETVTRKTEELVNQFKSEIENINSACEAEAAKSEQEVKQVELQLQAERVQAPEPPQFEQVKVPDQVDNVAKEHTVGQSVPLAEGTAEQSQADALEQEELEKYGNSQSWQIFLQSQKLIEVYEEGYREFLTSEQTAKFRFDCRIAINTPINAISVTSRQHLLDKFERINNLFAGKAQPNIMLYPQGAAFCKQLLAKKIMNQGETVISSKADLAFGVAALAVAFWSDCPIFGELFMANLRTSYPYLIPLAMPHIKPTPEERDKEVKKNSGCIRLYAAMIVTKQRRGVTKPHPHGLQNAWHWLAAILNIEPRADAAEMCITLIFDMLEITGNALWTTYPSQFPKLLHLLMTEYLPRVKNLNVNVAGPLGRLEQFMFDSVTKGSIPPPKGQLVPDFW